jgi:hypothetical protein
MASLLTAQMAPDEVAAQVRGTRISRVLGECASTDATPSRQHCSVDARAAFSLLVVFAAASHLPLDRIRSGFMDGTVATTAVHGRHICAVLAATARSCRSRAACLARHATTAGCRSEGSDSCVRCMDVHYRMARWLCRCLGRHNDNAYAGTDPGFEEPASVPPATSE